jgi:uncharacterized protein (TIGR03083 family)
MSASWRVISNTVATAEPIAPARDADSARMIDPMTPPSLPEGLDPFNLLDTEQDRVGRFLASLDGAGWEAGTDCAGWRRREMVAHLAGGEVYNLACLDDRLADLFAEAGAAGVTDVDSFNAWQVRLREELAADEVLDEWRSAAADVRRRLGELGPEARLTTMVGPYPIGPQAFHLAFEAAIHGDDMQIPVGADERAGRQAWMARFCAWALTEEDRPVETTREPGGVRARSSEDGAEAVLDDGTFIAHFAGRRVEPSLPASLATALRLYG